MFLTKSKLALTCITAAMSTCAMANEAVISNSSSPQQPITLVYKVAHKNPGQATQFSAPQTIEINNSTKVDFELGDYALAGIVPVSLNGHTLPADVTTFDMKNRCSLTTDRTHPSGEIAFNLSAYTVSCSVRGGVFNS